MAVDGSPGEGVPSGAWSQSGAEVPAAAALPSARNPAMPAGPILGRSARPVTAGEWPMPAAAAGRAPTLVAMPSVTTTAPTTGPSLIHLDCCRSIQCKPLGIASSFFKSPSDYSRTPTLPPAEPEHQSRDDTTCVTPGRPQVLRQSAVP